ncbi:queuine tRNA-ribosyltransferase accessory subunit 2 isoform X2 [Cimex lectularius]|nr:queuine tRNA-ribosyltransferase accessory subunit 2 isoform X2 [Cimex lectularius]XP_014246437.1 queuine tRNA-ribosyltransferase accessory subunit 2 isoform X2 [Cimex lectularius]XP_014246446.1 queuine tRNA-ribosyltransferase accessory subunit 2 isoform X2 [Cimex lectularius]
MSSARHGVLSSFSKFPEKIFETPLLLVSTKGGSVPHITHEVLQLITKDSHIMQFPLPSTMLSHETVKEYAKGLAHFCGLKDYLTYCTVQDPSCLTPVGYNKTTVVSVWTNIGRVSVNAEKYMKTMEAFQPDMYQILANTDTNLDSTRKKALKTLRSCQIIFDECIKRHQESEKLKNSGVIGVISGGIDLDVRKDHVKYMLEKPVSGFSIEGLHNNGADVEKMDYEKCNMVLEEILNILPEDKLRIVPGCWKPQQVLKMVELGVDMFDSSFPFIVTERMCALTFSWKSIPLDVSEVPSQNVEEEINLRDIRYKEDFGPLKKDCTCLPCRKHTRAYVYHLIESKELLASTLLMMHNLHQYIEFFKAIRQSVGQAQRILLY